MAVLFKTALGNNFNNVSGTTLVLNPTVAVAVGDLVVVRWAADNLSATSPTGAITDSGGNTWTTLRQAGVNATAAAGIVGGMAVTKATAVIAATTGTITLTLTGGSVAGKAMYAESFTGAETTVRSTTVGTTGTATAASAGVSGTVNSGDLVLGFIANETRALAATGATGTTGGSWSTQVSRTGGGTSGQDATSVTIAGQYKIATAAGAQTYSLTAVGSEWVIGCSVLQASPDPAITQAAYGFFNDGTETGSTTLAATNTAITSDVTNGDVNVLVRMRLQLTTAVGTYPSDDYQLQWDKNSAGAWANVTAASTGVRAFNSANLTDAAATTNRLGAGTGSFVAGKVSEDGLVDDFSWSGSNYTELLYAVTLRQADLAQGDSVRFHINYNGASTLMTYTQTPLINVTKAAIAVTQAAYRFFDDAGTESGAAALAAQNTSIVGNLDNGDGYGALRVLLQSTTTANLLATDDWQLQWEKNASGNWLNVVASSTEALLDSYAETNIDTTAGIGQTASPLESAYAQSFLGDGKILTKASFYINRIGTGSPGNIIARLWAHTGTFGTNGTGTGAPLASSAGIACSSISTTNGWVDFTFSGGPILSSGTPYVIGIEVPSAVGDAANYVNAGYDGNAPTHPGLASRIRNGVWALMAFANSDFPFRVYTAPVPAVLAWNNTNLTDGAATTNRMTGGTGTFTAGKVSETGLVSDLGWSGNNYTELLYSLKLTAANFVDGDAVRFRVLRNGVVTGMTHTQVPLINIQRIILGGKMKWWNGSTWVDKPVKWYNGSAWAEKPLKVYVGGTWVLS